MEYCVAFVPTKFLSHFQGVKFSKSCSQHDSKSNSWATELCVMIQLQPSHIASLWKLCVGSDKRWRWHTKTAMSTSVEGAADADDGVENLVVSDPVIGEWTDSYTNAYTITGTNGRYSVTVT